MAPNKKKNSKKQSSKEKFDSSKEKFDNSPKGLIDLISMSPSAGDNPVTWQDQMKDY